MILFDVDQIRQRAKTTLKQQTADRLFRPISTVPVEEWTGPQFCFGVRAVDNTGLRLRPGETCMIVGYAQSGKTSLARTMVHHNRNWPCVWFAADEPLPMVRERFQQVTSLDQYPVLCVRDEPSPTLAWCTEVVQDAINQTEMTPIVVVDYLEKLGLPGLDVPAMARQCVAWAKTLHIPLLLLHQESRGHAKLHIGSLMAAHGGGDKEVHHLVHIRRPDSTQPYGYIGVYKNKRTGITHPPEGEYFYIDEKGLIV